MDEATRRFHRFTRPPFGPVEAPGEVFVAGAQTEAAIGIIEKLRDGGTILAIVRGDPGSGKTVFAFQLAAMLRESGLETVQIAPADRTPMQIHARIAACGGMKDGHLQPVQMLQAMLAERGLQQLVVLVDDADHLPAESLRYLWHLMELRFLRSTQIHLILLGRPGRWPGVQQPDLDCLRVAVSASYVMRPFSTSEAAAYLSHRLQLAGRPRRLVMSRAVEDAAIARSRGLPGHMNEIMNAALSAGHKAGRRRITLQLLQPPAARNDRPPRAVPPSRQTAAYRWPACVAFGALATLAVAAAAFVTLDSGPDRRAGATPAHLPTGLSGRSAMSQTSPPRPGVSADGERAPREVALASMELKPARLSPEPSLSPAVADVTVEPAPQDAGAVLLPHARLGLAFPAAQGDSLQSLYVKIYRGVRPPPFDIFLAANPRPLRSGNIVFFPDPPNGWVRQMR